MGRDLLARDKKLREMQTKNAKKTSRKLTNLGKKKKISRNISDSLRDIKSRKNAGLHQLKGHVEDDWADDRLIRRETEDNDDALPLDMLDADIDWEKSAFSNMRKRYAQRMEEDEEDFEVKKRSFAGQLKHDEEEMLPIKLQDGRLIRPTRQKDEEEDQEDEEEKPEKDEDETKPKQEDYSHLSASELLAKRKELLDEFKEEISTSCQSLLGDPESNIMKLRKLYRLCKGEEVHTLVRETVQKLAVVSMMQILVDIVPGYSIRVLTDEERQQKQKKETKKLIQYEESHLRYHLKFLQLCEKFAMKFDPKHHKLVPESFSYKIGFLSLKALCRIMVTCAHFNYTTNIVSMLVRLSSSKNKEVATLACDAIAKMFSEDVYLKMSLFGSRSISTYITKMKGRVNPDLIRTLLSLTIKEVEQRHNKSQKTKIFAQRARVKKERSNKTARKYKKQLDKLEADLKELDNQEVLSEKLKNATEAMKYVFQAYFSVLKRMPDLKLLEPCLEGLSQFAHLLNVEFFDDIVKTMEDLVERKNLRIVDQIYCIHTVFIILSGEGKILNVDPSKFYRSLYRILNTLPFEAKPELKLKQLTVTAKALYCMLNERRKQVPLCRVAAFVKRLLAIATLMDDPYTLCIISIVRSLFIAHPKISTLTDDDECGGGAGGICRLDIDDPDVSNALGTNVILELKLLSKRRNRDIKKFANNILNGCPSTGPHYMPPSLVNKLPEELMKIELDNDSMPLEMKYLKELEAYCKKKGQELTTKNVQFHISTFLESRRDMI
ncbi:unnamed protein product [Auanema sp. JU1783]|nr:unnamed protein product [Auanema sp. JU1783]